MNNFCDPKQEIKPKETLVSRDYSGVAFLSLSCILSIGLAVWMHITFAENSLAALWAWFIPGVLGLFGLLCIFGLFKATGKAPCPNCGKTVEGLSMGMNDAVLCKSCHKYLENVGGKIKLIPIDRVASTPVFRAPFQSKPRVTPEEQSRFPDLCCECGEPAERMVMIDVITSDSGEHGHFYYDDLPPNRILVPHCKRHETGCKIVSTLFNSFDIFFKSYSCLVEFCRLNGVQPKG